jgi:hypothetical protein
VVITPQDELETARPEQGVVIRVRCAWENTAQGLLKKPLTELVKLTVDGAEVVPKFIAAQQPRGAAYRDHYHLFHLLVPVPGRHTVTAVVRAIETKTESSRTIEFVV